MRTDNGFVKAQAQYESQLPPEPKVIGHCANCRDEVYSHHWEDGNGNLFCDELCAEQYYGIVERGK